MRRAAAAVAGALGMVVLLGACSTGGSGTKTSSSSAVARDMASSPGQANSALKSTAAATGAGAAAATGAPSPASAAVSDVVPAGIAQPKVVKTATLQLEVGNRTFAKAFSQVATIASSFGGFVSSSTSAAGTKDDVAAGTLVLRIPSDKFDAARAELHKLGKLTNEQLSGEDVGGQLADLDARLRNLRAQEEAIRALMTKAKDVNETLTVQNQLSAVRQQIEQLASQQARLNDSVSYSTITVGVAEPGAVTTPSSNVLAKAWRQAVHGAAAVIAGVIVLAGYLLPIALLMLIAFVIARVAWRTRATRLPVVPSAPVEHSA